jgi:S-(hydroxymethyl)glutathione dehydrogenase/alcohol dehydrogenase
MAPNMPRGFVLGHETMGIVEEPGKAVRKVKKGDRVVIPFPISCGHCWYCRHDLWSQCDNSNANGEAGAIFGYSKTYGGYDGGQAEYPYANVGPTLVPEELIDEQVLFLTDILPTSYWGVENGGVKKDDTVVVLDLETIMNLTRRGVSVILVLVSSNRPSVPQVTGEMKVFS